MTNHESELSELRNRENQYQVIRDAQIAIAVGRASEHGIMPSKAKYLIAQGLNPLDDKETLLSKFHRYVSLSEGAGVYTSTDVAFTRDVINGANPEELNWDSYAAESAQSTQDNIRRFGFDPDPHRGPNID